MRYLVFNTKGGCGKSLITREIIAAPLGKQITIVEVDELNETQKPYLKHFNDVIELKKNNIKELLIPLVEFDNVVVDIGVDNLTKTIQTMVEYSLLQEIDKIVIPLGVGRSDSENALKTYEAMSKHCQNIMFAFTLFDPDESIENQYPVFFKNVKRFIDDFSADMYITINNSDIFTDAQNDKKIVLEMAKDIDYKSAAINAKKSGNIDKFKTLMHSELQKRAAQILVNNCIMPAHQKLLR